MTHISIAPPLPTAISVGTRDIREGHWPRRVIRWATLGVAGVLGLLVAVAGAGFVYQTVAADQDQRTYPAPGELIGVAGSHRLHIQCVGAGSPIVVTESGFAGTSLDWSLVQPAVAQSTRICAYDRAGFGWSDTGPSPRSSGRIVEELHTLLANAGIPGPYVLVGHSVGGLHAQLFASQYPGEVSGLVLLDPTPAAYLASLDLAAQREAAPPVEQVRTIQLMQYVGLTRLFGLSAPMPAGKLSPEVQQQAKAVGFRSAVGDALFEEASAYRVNLAEAMTAAPLRADIPLVVIVRGLVMGPADQDAAGKAANADLARRSTRGELVVAERSEHYIHLDRPDLVIGAIERVVRALRQS